MTTSPARIGDESIGTNCETPNLFCYNLFKRNSTKKFWEREQSVQKTEEEITAEKPNSWWYRVYLAVIATTVLVIAALWAFSFYFSK